MPTIAQLEKLLAVDPTDAFVLYALAQEHAKAEQHEQALKRYDECIAADEAYCYAYFHQARSYEALGQTAEGVATLERGLAIAQRDNDGKATSEITEYLGRLRRSASTA